MDPASSLSTKLAFALGSLCLMLLLVLALVFSGRIGLPGSTELSSMTRAELMAIPAARDAIQAIAGESSAAWDSHVDPAVARVMPSNAYGITIWEVECRSNEHGMREDAYALEKPADTLRVVILGDSYVFGHGTLFRERMGVYLHAYLSNRSANPPAKLEVLHVGISSWNVLAECAYMRRQLDLMRPDLVFHIVVPNDLDDTNGVRGWGGLGRYTPLHRERAGGLVSHNAARIFASSREANLVPYGLDWESRTRFEQSAAEIGRLERAIEAQGGEYLLLIKGPGWLPAAGPHLSAELDESQVAYVSNAFCFDKSTWVGEGNNHWNGHGNERIAKLMFGLIQGRGYLAELGLEEWHLANEEVETIHGQGLRDSQNPNTIPNKLEAAPLLSDVAFGDLMEVNARHLNGGLDGAGYACPYASLILRNEGASELLLEAENLGRFELEGAVVTVYVEEFEVGSFALGTAGPIEARFELPPELASRPFVSVRLSASDFVYKDSSEHPCFSYRLLRLALS